MKKKGPKRQFIAAHQIWWREPGGGGGGGGGAWQGYIRELPVTATGRRGLFPWAVTPSAHYSQQQKVKPRARARWHPQQDFP